MSTVWKILLFLFVLTNIYAFYAGNSLSGLWEYLQNPGPWGILAIADLVIALIVALSFIARDARSKGVNHMPYLLLTLFTGSIGILVYLIQYWGKQDDAIGRPDAALLSTEDS